MGRPAGASTAVEAGLRRAAEPIKRRVRARGPDPLAAGRRARRAEPPFGDDIDVVITWVDDSDESWRASRDAAITERSGGRPVRDSSTDARYRSLGELRYVLRGIDRHMPWVRQVVLVTSGQAPPSWLDATAVRIVPHQEFMRPAALPTFNSHAIEAALWRIEGLAEHFVYFNDDVLVTRDVRPNDFFTPAGWPRSCLTRLPVPLGAPQASDSAAISGARNARQLLADAGFGQANRLLAHTPVPQRRALHREIGEAFPEALAGTELAPFRSADDVAPIFLHVWYALLTGRGEEVLMTHRYVELSEPGGPRRLAVDLGRGDVDFVCANLAADPAVRWDELADQVDGALRRAFATRSPYER